MAREERGTLVLDAALPGDMARAADILRAGGLVAFPTETVYGLGADGLNPDAVRRIFVAKGRPADNPLILHLDGPEMLGRVAQHIPAQAERLMAAFWPGPLTLVLERRPEVPDAVTAGLDTVAVRCPDHPVARELIAEVGRPLAAPSANRSGRPSPTRAEDVLEDLAGRIDAVLDGGPTGLGIESTVLDLTVDPPALLRPGGVPLEDLREFLPRVVAVGEATGPVRSPGMKYAHYAPRAYLVLVEGPEEAVAAEIRRLAAKYRQDGRTVAILAVTGQAYPGETVLRLGPPGHWHEIAASLYRTLRELDRRGIEVALAEGIPRAGLGLAIMDRLERAAREVISTGGTKC